MSFSVTVTRKLIIKSLEPIPCPSQPNFTKLLGHSPWKMQTKTFKLIM